MLTLFIYLGYPILKRLASDKIHEDTCRHNYLWVNCCQNTNLLSFVTQMMYSCINEIHVALKYSRRLLVVDQDGLDHFS